MCRIMSPSGGPIATPAMGARTGPPRFARKRLPVDTSFRPLSTKWGCPSAHDPTHLYLLAEIALVFGYRT